MIHNLTPDMLKQACRETGYPDYRANQIWRWLYKNYADDWDIMLNLPHDLRVKLARKFTLKAAIPAQTAAESGPGATDKIAVQLSDGEIVETVLIPASKRDGNERRTVCISSQVGCKFHCTFCASGQAGFRRNLTAAEMVGQVLVICRQLTVPPSNVVFMGIGEPMDNYDNVLAAIRILNHPDGLRIGARRITISTCGVIPGIKRLAEEGLQVELSVSLHAAADTLRSKLMPVNRRYSLQPLLAVCREYTEKTGRIITFEYTLIDQVNAAPEQARALRNLLRRFPCRVNLIPLSPVAEFAAHPPPPTAAASFRRILEQAGINTTLRNSRGSSINAACGQLRASHHSSQ